MSLLDLHRVLGSLPEHTVHKTEVYYNLIRDLCIQSAEVRCHDLSFSVHLYTETSPSPRRFVRIYLTHSSWQNLCKAWNPMINSIPEIFAGHYFLVFEDLFPVLSYDQILTAMMHHVFQP